MFKITAKEKIWILSQRDKSNDTALQLANDVRKLGKRMGFDKKPVFIVNEENVEVTLRIEGKIDLETTIANIVRSLTGYNVKLKYQRNRAGEVDVDIDFFNQDNVQLEITSYYDVLADMSYINFDFIRLV